MKLSFTILILAALVGCANRNRTKVDESSASGHAIIDEGARTVEVNLDGIEKEPLTNSQKAHANGARTGVGRIRDGAVISAKAYDKSAKLNEPAAQKQAWTIFLWKLGGVAVMGVGVFLLVGNSGFGAAYGLATIAGGGSITLMLITMEAVTPAIKVAVWAVAGMGVIAVGWLIYDRIFKKKELKTERKATEELVKTVDVLADHMPEPDREAAFKSIADANIQSPPTETLVTKAKAAIKADMPSPHRNRG